MQNISSGLAYIEVNDSNPFHLFNEWKTESEECGNLAPSIMNLATCSRLRRFLKSMFLFADLLLFL